MLCHHGGPALIDLALSQKTEPLVFMLAHHRPRFAAKTLLESMDAMANEIKLLTGNSHPMLSRLVAER